MEFKAKPTTRAKSTSIKSKLVSNVQKSEQKWVWILRNGSNETLSEFDDFGDVITLRHPGTGTAALFLYLHDNTIQEIMSCEDKKRSWFIGDYVKSDGKLKLSTPIDPLFLVLPYLRKLCSTQATPVDQLLCDEEFPKTELLLKCKSMKMLDLIADKKGADDLQAYKFNEDKTLKWLELKTRKVASILEKKGGDGITNFVVSSSFTKSSRNENNTSDNSSYLKYAHGIVSDYIEPELSQKLLHHLNLHEEPIVNLKRKSSTTSMDAKKIKIEKDENTSVNTQPQLLEVKPVVKVSSKEKLRVKAASGSKSISSFFKKKT